METNCLYYSLLIAASISISGSSYLKLKSKLGIKRTSGFSCMLELPRQCRECWVWFLLSRLPTPRFLHLTIHSSEVRCGVRKLMSTAEADLPRDFSQVCELEICPLPLCAAESINSSLGVGSMRSGLPCLLASEWQQSLCTSSQVRSLYTVINVKASYSFKSPLATLPSPGGVLALLAVGELFPWSDIDPRMPHLNLSLWFSVQCMTLSREYLKLQRRAPSNCNRGAIDYLGDCQAPFLAQTKN